jgi:hypothetical protein
MTTDRELLELAAKAAGYKIHKAHQSARDALIDPATASLWIDGVSTGWNPLRDDGHALRLAVKLKLMIDCMSGGAMPIAHDIGWSRGFTHDPYAATRRAIVRAAAEIGKAMP